MSFTWLHISDFHFKAGDPYDRDVVLRALLKAVKRYRDEGRVPNVIFATGDIADSGEPTQYDIATTFFDELLSVAGLKKAVLFLVPGNHDVDLVRSTGLSRTLQSREEADEYFGRKDSLPHLLFEATSICCLVRQVLRRNPILANAINLRTGGSSKSPKWTDAWYFADQQCSFR